MPKRDAPHRDIRLRFGHRIRKLRQARGWAQIDLAVDSGISRGNISRLENGHFDAKLSTLQALAGSFGITIGQLMRGF